ncbi:DUF2206 domain-containing protein [Haloferax volcanii]
MPRQIISLLFIIGYLITWSERSNRLLYRVGSLSFLVCSVLSHYATAILFMFWFSGGLVGILAYEKIQDRIDLRSDRVSLPHILTFFPRRLIIHILLAGVVLFGWYAYVSSGVLIDQLGLLVYEFFIGTFQVLLGLDSSNVTQVVSGSSTTIYQTITKGLFFIILALSGIGAIYYGYSLADDVRISAEDALFYFIGVATLGFLSTSVVFPFFDLELTRLVQIALIFIAPFIWYGFRVFWDTISLPKSSMRATIAAFLLIFLLFNSGVVYDYTGERPNNAVLSQNSIHTQSDSEKVSYYNFYTMQQEDARSATWYRAYSNSERTLYSTGLSTFAFESFGMVGPRATTYWGDNQDSKQLTGPINVQPDSYVFKSYVNTQEEIYTVRRSNKPLEIHNISRLRPVYQNASKIYTTRNTSIYHVPQ